MKNILCFITSNFDHVEMCLEHLGRSYDPLIFDEMYIYNSHQKELSNDIILDLTKKYNINTICNTIKLFPYDDNIPKTLGDCDSIFNYLIDNYYLHDDRILLLKSDIIVSVNFLNELKNIQNSLDEKFILSPILISPKEKLTNKEIRNIISSDEIVFNEKDEKISFSSFFCHYFSLLTIWDMNICENTDDINFLNCKEYWICTMYSFVVHKSYSNCKNIENEESDILIEGYFTN